MTERPILFSAPMIRALLTGQKSQTRRIVKPQPSYPHGLQPMFGTSPDGYAFGEPGLWREVGPDYPDGDSDDRRCPYGAAGDRLWVRETWAAAHVCDHLPPRMIREGARIHYRASEDLGGLMLRPSIFMPRWASRITLEVTGVRVEGLQDVSTDDIRAEGVDGLEDSRLSDVTIRDRFARLWNHINGKRAPWDTSPWVWVVSFRRVGAQAARAA